MTIGILHPGSMGATIGATCADEVVWAGDGRSDSTRARAERAGFRDVGSIDAMAAEAHTIVAVCPPAAAIDLAARVAATGFSGVYVDANALSPATARSIGDRFERFVDGGIVGPPATRAGLTRLYLAGADAEVTGSHWSNGVIDVRVVDGGPGSASAVKACFAAWTKGSAALLIAVRALARAEAVEADLLAEWATSMPDLPERSEHAATRTAGKAWRFAGEMEELAAAFHDAGLPDGFHRAAAEVYGRLDGFKDVDPAPDLDAVLARLLGSSS